METYLGDGGEGWEGIGSVREGRCRREGRCGREGERNVKRGFAGEMGGEEGEEEGEDKV